MSPGVKELINNKNTVRLQKSDGTIIQWSFVYEPRDSGYYADQTVNGRENKSQFLGKDREKAQELWNSVIRHRRDLNK